jgi:hypothetical protein
LSRHNGPTSSKAWDDIDLPGNMELAATAIVAQASGTVKSRVTVLMTPEDVDQAVQRKVEFRPPE